ncbi:MAG: hypothetical protein IJY27_05880 [Clostridia bacterium]|nr:hypothetical protein [Clostridia bacterium]
MKKRNMITLIAAMLAVVGIGGALFFIFTPSGSVWDIAEFIGQDDDFLIWISDSEYHNHFINSSSDQHSDAVKVLNGLKLSRKKGGKRTFADAKNTIVLETTGFESPARVQYFLFNEDFTVVWVADNSWIYENSRGSQEDGTYHAGMIFDASNKYNEWTETECAAYRVRNPRAVREFFEAVCEQDDKYDQK